MNALRTHVFLFDGLGALGSTLALAFVLPAFESVIGLPRSVLFLLAGPAAVFAAWSLSCALLGARPWPWLAVVMVGNVAYCLLSLLALAYHLDTITAWGVAYVLGEIAVIACVVAVERSVLRGAPASPELVPHGLDHPLA